MNSRRRITVALVGLLALVIAGWFVRELTGSPARPQSSVSSEVPGAASSGLRIQPLSALPPEAGRTWGLITSNGPFPFPRNDGVVFGNRERRLPQERAGYYHEYTVPTPGSRDRGARRLITGQRAELYYTGDHYESFVVVDPKR